MSQYPSSFYTVAEIIGDEAARKLCEAFGGDTIYVPKVETLDSADRVAEIRAAYNGSNIKALAERYGLTRMRVYQIVGDMLPKIDGQMDIDDFLK